MACGPDDPQSDKYINQIAKIFELAPPSVQKLTCTLKSLKIVDRTDPAYGRYFSSSETIELVHDLFKEESHDEQTAQSSGISSRYSFDHADLDGLDYEGTPRQFMSFMHELGHHFQQKFIFGDPLSCVHFRNGRQNGLTKWERTIRAWRYQNSHPIAPSERNEFYRWLEQSPYVSTYSIIRTTEEYAEAFTYYVAVTHLGMRYQIFDDDTSIFDTGSPTFVASKKEGQHIIGTLLNAYFEDDIGARFSFPTCGRTAPNPSPSN